MSQRRRYVVVYDISDDRRLRQVHDIVVAHGDRLQYSVYVCDLSYREKLALKAELRDVINHSQDRIAFIDLGAPNNQGTDCFEFMGINPRLPSDGEPTII